MRPITRWEDFKTHFVWGQWSMLTPPKLRKFGKDRTFVVGKLKISWTVRS